MQSRIKELEKIERIEIPPEEKTIHFSFPQPKPSGRIVAEFKEVAKSYGSKEVFRDVNFMIERGDRIALVGVNGAGKSTLIKLLAGTEPLTHGEYNVGHNVEADYFAQDQYKELDQDARILDDIAELSPRSTQTELRSLLGCFLFQADDVFKRIGVLSGGERGRYALLRLLLHPANFLLLDEPTNHLDMRAKDILLEALAAYTGTVVLFRTIATSSTSWLRASSKSAKAGSRSIPEITRTTAGGKRAEPWLCLRSTMFPCGAPPRTDRPRAVGQVSNPQARLPMAIRPRKSGNRNPRKASV